MSEVLHRLATKEAVDALTAAIEALPNATQEAADEANEAAEDARAATERIDGLVYQVNVSSTALVPFNVKRGETITIKTADGSPFTVVDSLCFYDDNGTLIESYGTSPIGAKKRTFTYNYADASQLMILKSSDAVIEYTVYNESSPYLKTVRDGDAELQEQIDRKSNVINYPTNIRNGSYGNAGNTSAVCMGPFLINENTKRVVFETDRELADGGYYSLGYDMTSRVIGNLDYSSEGWVDGFGYDRDGTYRFGTEIEIPENAKMLFLTVAQYTSEPANVPIRKEDFDGYHVRMLEFHDPDNAELLINNSRHVRNTGVTPLTLLHFSDLHGDRGALKRIMANSSKYAAKIDDKICTGDIVANTAEAITAWWAPSVLTCIGNHDSASYAQATGYDWTALSMADRDAYYIEPFESNWGITHTRGTSYYFKDYPTQKVRLIVMDGMLYSSNGSEATTQTSWLGLLLADAISNNLHVVIAIHAPHGGATAEACSFSKYGATEMPTWSDCNTPQVVIDTVADAIENGLHFVGYLVGHTHQDNIWDAENDGTQLMYCITCAAVSQTGQWINSDQNRNINQDAYNLVTIDTANTLVKLIRCGGAEVDDHMRPRKAICFNYTTGEKVGEVL